MNFIKIALCAYVLGWNTPVSSQQRVTAQFGKPTYTELQMKSYPADTEAAGVVLYEKGKNYVKLTENNYVKLIKEVHRKIKVIDAKNFEQSVIVIPYFKTSKSREDVKGIKAITHNGNTKTYVKEADIFETQENENWYLKRFTFPNIKDGSVLEYSFTIESPFFFNFGSWEFQGYLPKVYSEFVSEMPGNYVYHKSLVGTEKLTINEVSLKEDCFWLPGYAVNADCELGVYAMENIPAFKEEAYMLAAENYRSRLKFELKERYDFKGTKTEHSKDWGDVDKEFRTSKDLGGQTKFGSYFEKNLPPGVTSGADPKQKAESIYNHIRDHFNWDGKYRVFSGIDVKEAYKRGSGNATEINLSLLNALKSAGMEAKMVLIGTRDYEIPTQLYPVMTEFNYVVILLTLGQTEYLLDATDKETPFGLLPMRALNAVGRVMDFKKGSYWMPIEPYPKNLSYISLKLAFENAEKITGTSKETHTGYAGVALRKDYRQKGKRDYIKTKENEATVLSVTNYVNTSVEAIDQPFEETYEVALETELIGDQVFLYPFVLPPFFEENPFTLEKRQYPVDFGFPFNQTYACSIDLNNTYQLVDIPENKRFSLPDGSGECTLIYSHDAGKINMRFTIKLNRYHFVPEYYDSLKDFISEVITVQTKDVITLKKV